MRSQLAIVIENADPPHAVAVALDDQAISVVLNLMKPVSSGRDAGSARGNARLIRCFSHGITICNGTRIFESALHDNKLIRSSKIYRMVIA
jgi:hypothetical protein